MQRKDYVAITLFAAAFVMSALLAGLSLAGYSVLLWGIACLLGWGYFNYRNRWWKRGRKTQETA